jgi:hypothetical protein
MECPLISQKSVCNVNNGLKSELDTHISWEPSTYTKTPMNSSAFGGFSSLELPKSLTTFVEELGDNV